jgi:hypothetical protein
MLNNIFLPNIIFYLLILLGAYSITYIIGKIALNFVPEICSEKNPVENVFSSLIIGFVVLISLFAIIWTKGNSIFLSSILIIGFYFLIRKKKYRNKKKIFYIKFSKKELVIFLSVFVLFILFFFISYYLFFIRSKGEFYCDHIFYANVSNVLSTSHVENSSLFVGETNAGMYHFSELWFTVFLSKIFGANFLYVFLLVVSSYFASMIVLGGFSIAKIYFKGFVLPILLGTTLLFFRPIVAIVIPFINPLALNSKLFVITAFLLFATLQYLRKNTLTAFIFLFLLVPFYSTISPGVLSGLFFLTLCLEIYKKGFQLKAFFNSYTLVCVSVFLFFVLFYLAQPFIFQHEASSKMVLLYDHPLKRTLMFIINRSARVFVLLLPISLILCFIHFRIKDKNTSQYWIALLFVVLGVVISSVVGGVAANFVLDGGQICTNFTDTVVIVVIYTILLYALSFFNERKVLLIGIFFLLVYSVMFFYKGLSSFYPIGENNQNEKECKFYAEIKNEIFAQNNPQFAYYRNYEIAEHHNSQYTRLMMILPLSKMPHVLYSGYYAPYCLSVFDIPQNIDSRFDEREKSDFWKFVHAKRKMNPTVSLDDCALNFIKIKDIKYIILEKYANVPNYLLSNAFLLNEYDGNRIYKINTGSANN